MIQSKLMKIGNSKYIADYLDQLLEKEQINSFPIFIVKFTGEKIKISVTKEMTIKKLKIRMERKFRAYIVKKKIIEKSLNWKSIWRNFTLILPNEKPKSQRDFLKIRGVRLIGDHLNLDHFKVKGGDELYFTPYVNKDTHTKAIRYKQKKRKFKVKDNNNKINI